MNQVMNLHFASQHLSFLINVIMITAMFVEGVVRN